MILGFAPGDLGRQIAGYFELELAAEDNMANKWLVFEFLTTHEAAFPISRFLDEIGAIGIVSVDKADFLKTFFEQQTPDAIIGEFLDELSFDVKMEAYFSFLAEQESIIQLEKQIREALIRIAEFCEIGKGYLGWHLVQDEDWENNWKAFYHTLKINQLVINPSWISYRPKPDEVLLQLDPGSAFGTGSHETTALLLELLSRINPSEFHPHSILDVGTGSGILAIAAKKLFPYAETTGFDIDENAVVTAQHNAQENQVNIRFERAELKDFAGSYDLILANLIASIHLDLAEQYYDKLSTDGILLVSGIIEERVAEVREKLLHCGFKLEKELSKNDWYAIKCCKDYVDRK